MRPPGDRGELGPAVVPMRRLKSAVLAFFAAVLAASLVAGTLSFSIYGGLAELPRHVLTALVLTPLALPLALPVVVIVALPTLLVLQRFGWHRVLSYGLAGALAGGVVTLLGVATFGGGYREFFGETPAMKEIVGLYGAGALGGLAGALTFWAIHRPDLAARGQA